MIDRLWLIMMTIIDDNLMNDCGVRDNNDNNSDNNRDDDNNNNSMIIIEQ